MGLKTAGALGIVIFVSTFLLAAAAQAAIPPSEREALIAVYESTDGDNWSNQANWRKSPGVFNDPGTECTWFGVTCDAAGTTVSGLGLYGNQLSGTIPPELGNLVSLEDLSLSSNQLTGPIPTELASLTNLQYLILHRNQLTGSIPPELGSLANLQSLYLQINQLTGPVPPGLGNLANLQRLALRSNQLSGTIPAELANLANLQSLDLGNNQLTGTIPAALANLANLEDFASDSNQLSGTIPPELGNLAKLEELALRSNQLSGTIPPELGNLINLQVLYIDNNALDGTIPPELGNLAKLADLFLGHNELTGAIPPDLGNLVNLQYLDLQYNQLSGPVPPELGNLGNLLQLYLFRNQLTGAIPSELGKLGSLLQLQFAGNHLTGSIPPELGNLASLQALVLESNDLSGSIPPELGNLDNLQYLDLRSNQLSGAIPLELSQLANLTLRSGLQLQTNHLFTDDNSLREFLNSRQYFGDWESFQTIDRYFAQFADGGGLFSQVVLFNLNDVSAATGQLEILGDSGDGLTVDLNGETVAGTKELSVPATGLLSLRTDGLGDVQTGSVRVTTDRHVEGVVIFGGGIGLAGVGSSPEFPSGFVAPMERNESLGINTGIAGTVLGGTEAALDLTLLDGGGNAIAHATDQVAAQGHAALFVTEVGWNAAVDFSSFSGTLVVTSSEPITGTVIQTRPGEFVTIPVAPLQGPAAAEHRLYFAQFADGAGALSSQILLFNLSDGDEATAEITIRDNAGALLTVDLDGQPVSGEKQVAIGPRALRVLATDGLGDLQVGSVAVTSDQPLAGVILFAGPSVGAAGVGSSAELEEGFVAPMETDEARGINTGVAVMSLETETITLDADLLGSGGQLLASAQVQLAGLGHAALFVTDFQWNQSIDFSQFEGLLRIRAGGRTAATVIQTRPGQFATMPVAPKPAD